MAAPDLSRSRAWVLVSVALASRDGPAPLDRVVMAGDYVDHAVFTADELADGLGWLLASGLVCRDGDGFAVSAGARERLAGGHVRALHDVAARLVADAARGTPARSREAPTESECRRAIRAYLGTSGRADEAP